MKFTQNKTKKYQLSILTTAILSALSMPSEAYYNFDVNENFTIRVLEPSDDPITEGGNTIKSEFNLDDNYIKAIQIGFGYWNDILKNNITNKALILVSTKEIPDSNAGASSEILKDLTGSDAKWNTYTALTATIYQPNDDHKEWTNDDASGFILIDRDETYDVDAGTDWQFDVMTNLPESKGGSNLPSTLVHELAHAFGLLSDMADPNSTGSDYAQLESAGKFSNGLRDIYGNSLSVGQDIVDKAHHTEGDGNFVLDNTDGAYTGLYFTGKYTQEVLNGAYIDLPSDANENLPAVQGIPINSYEGDEADFSHLELQNALMSHQNYRNWNILMEAELAVMQDCGLILDRKNLYGYSIYNSGTEDHRRVFVNNNPYYARTEDGQWIENTYNKFSYGTGLHIYGKYNDVYQQSDLLSGGLYGLGIRVDGQSNNLNILKDSKVSADGFGGIGILVAYGKDHNLTVNGSVTATGAEGTALRFDFGDNNLGNNFEYRGSYIRTVNNNLVPDLLPELEGSLVNDVSIAGTVIGRQNAILIGENAHVQNINFLQGAKVSGTIESKWDPNYDKITYSGDKADLITNLNFGYAKDSFGNVNKNASDNNFYLRYDGDIKGANSFVLNFVGGTTSINGKAEVLSANVEAGATLKGNAVYDLYNTPTGSLATGIFTNNGTLAPGNSIGSITIDGNYIQSNTGTLALEFDNHGRTDSFDVIGTANFDGNLRIEPTTDYYQGNEQKTFALADFVTATNITTTQDFLDSAVNPHKFSPTLTTKVVATGTDYNTASYTVSVLRSPYAYAQYSYDKNTFSIGSALGGGASTATIAAVRNLYATLDFSDVEGRFISSALTKLTPSAYANALQGIFDYQHFVNNETISDARLNLATLSPKEVQVYAKPYTMFSDRGHGYEGYSEAVDLGAIFGANTKTDNGALLGLYACANKRSQDSHNSASLDGINVYGGVKGLFNLTQDGLLKVFFNSNLGFDYTEVKRSNALGSTKAKVKSLLAATNVGLSYDFAFDKVTLIPQTNLEYALVHTTKIKEHGAATAQSLDADNFNSLKLGLGLNLLSSDFKVNDETTFNYLFGAHYRQELLSNLGTFNGNFRYINNSDFNYEASFLGKKVVDLNANAIFNFTTNQRLAFSLGTSWYLDEGQNTFAKLDYNYKF